MIQTQTLKTFDDCLVQKWILEEYIECHGHLRMFFPKYHCELSPIERVWCHAKKIQELMQMERLIHYGRLSLKDWKAVPKNLFTIFFRK